MTNGVAALRKIAAAKAHFVDFEDIGSRELVHTLWTLSGVDPRGDWLLKDETVSRWNILQFARSNDAYVVVGYIPARTGKMLATGMEILVKNDPVMRRPFIVMEANPKKFPQTNAAGAKALSDSCCNLALKPTASARSFIPSLNNKIAPYEICIPTRAVRRIHHFVARRVLYQCPRRGCLCPRRPRHHKS
jgi:hypothetical protein